jgi:hypothetical protein
VLLVIAYACPCIARSVTSCVTQLRLLLVHALLYCICAPVYHLLACFRVLKTSFTLAHLYVSSCSLTQGISTLSCIPAQSYSCSFVISALFLILFVKCSLHKPFTVLLACRWHFTHLFQYTQLGLFTLVSRDVLYGVCVGHAVL